MKSTIVSIVFTFFSLTVMSQNVIGTYRLKGPASLYFRKCRQLTLFSDSTYQNITCGEIVYPYHNSWSMEGDTLYFRGSSLGLPVAKTKFLFKKGKLYTIPIRPEIARSWTFRRKSRKPRPFKKPGANKSGHRTAHP